MKNKDSFQMMSMPVAPLFIPPTNRELVGDFTGAPAPGARLPENVPLPDGSGEVEFSFSTGGGGALSMTVLSVIVDATMAFHWYFDMSDDYTRQMLRAWDAQRGFQVHLYHEESDGIHPLYLYLYDGVNLCEMLAGERHFCGQDLTARFVAEAGAMCREAVIELPFLLSNPKLRRQSSWILGTPKVMDLLDEEPEGQAIGEGDDPSTPPAPSVEHTRNDFYG
ncbi:hypothetical protein [Paraburkholderia fungorum]|uniref:hypothetical protein n=1 Tax=Paraburkholderia fungorum TaxID=134537 RepID=UPI000409AF03|nr:hypothetical protein [Paraburkholderia fungorum]